MWTWCRFKYSRWEVTKNELFYFPCSSKKKQTNYFKNLFFLIFHNLDLIFIQKIDKNFWTIMFFSQSKILWKNNFLKKKSENDLPYSSFVFKCFIYICYCIFFWGDGLRSYGLVMKVMLKWYKLYVNMMQI